MLHLKRTYSRTRTALAAFIVLGCSSAWAQPPATPPSQLPLLVIGASFSEGKTPYNSPIAPLGGVSVGLGTFLSLGQALTRTSGLPGLVVNEAQAGATTFRRQACANGAAACGPARWDGYQTQLDQALTRVSVPGILNARYVVITMPNDCLHSDAFGVPQSQAVPCTLNDMNAVADRLVKVGQSALAKGIKPIYDIHPPYSALNLPLFQAAFGLTWVIPQTDYDTLRTLVSERIHASLPAAIQLDIWADFQHGGDGLHPNRSTTERAARRIAGHVLSLDSAPLR